jgi:5,10-methylene-tetrahydrofolate dehydrogenase/methenyl tetrahydrofolate cyclohydrolase
LKKYPVKQVKCDFLFRDLDKIVSEADILVVGIGSANFVKVNKVVFGWGVVHNLQLVEA